MCLVLLSGSSCLDLRKQYSLLGRLHCLRRHRHTALGLRRISLLLLLGDANLRCADLWDILRHADSLLVRLKLGLGLLLRLNCRLLRLGLLLLLCGLGLSLDLSLDLLHLLCMLRRRHLSLLFEIPPLLFLTLRYHRLSPSDFGFLPLALE